MPTPATRRCTDPSAYARAGFSLAELLVVVAVLAILIGLVLPALAQARQNARAGVCLSNLRQLILALDAYGLDYAGFPVGPAPTYHRQVRWGWGGVHWYGSAPETPVVRISAARPLNPYAGSFEQRLQSRSDAFRCPADTGAYLIGTNERSWDGFGAMGLSGEGQRTSFGAIGTSYEMNDWMYAEPGSSTYFGWGLAPAGKPPPRYRSSLGTRHIQITPSRSVVFGEVSTMGWGRYTLDERLRWNLFGAWWHGPEIGQFAFADGSASRQPLGEFPNQRYSYLLREAERPYGGWRRPTNP